MCKWSCKIVCTLPNETKYLHKLSSDEERIGGNHQASCVDCFFVKCIIRGTRTAIQFTALLTILKFGKHVSFFIQASPCTFFNSRYDLRGFLFDLIRNFRSYHYSWVFIALIFRGKVHY